MLAIEGITLASGQRNLLEGISLAFEPGVLYALLGPNGSGKSTLLKIISGIWRPTTGLVQWKGEDLLSKPRQDISRLISLVPQSPLVPFDFTAEEMVAMGRYPHGQSGKTRRERELILEALGMVDAVSLAGRKMSQLSVGERQRLYIARALVTESPVLLLDEPTASLDVRHEIEIWAILKRLALQGKTVIAATHNLQAALQHCEYSIALKDGHCCGSGATHKVVTPNLLQTLYGVIPEGCYYP